MGKKCFVLFYHNADKIKNEENTDNKENPL